jgi:glycine cleavage system H protein
MTVKFTDEHEWINAADTAAAVIGITVHAQDALGDVVFVDLPAVGTTFVQGDIAGVVESVKAAADVYAPLSGEIIEVNEALRDDPSLANTDPLGDGWFFKMKLSDPSQLDVLMDATGYDDLLAKL